MKINQDGCISCGACVESCPVSAIAIVKTHGYARFEIDPDKCVNCGKCKSECLGECITE